MKERVYLFDTTLRDGAQTNGVDFTLADKLTIAQMLDAFGLDYIEGGYPGANPTDTQLFSQARKLNARFTAFGMTRRPGRSAANDPGLAALLEARLQPAPHEDFLHGDQHIALRWRNLFLNVFRPLSARPRDRKDWQLIADATPHP